MDPLYDGAQSTAAYSRRLPSPPRVEIPPIPSDKDLRNRLHDPAYTGFLPAFDSLPQSTDQWQHKDRQFAQIVAPSIWLGPSSVAKNVDLLNDMNVRRVLMIRRTTRDFASKVTPAAVRIAKQAGIPTELIDVETYQQLASRFAATSALLDVYTRQLEGANVLVCCENGNDVAAAVVVAYIMTRYSINLVAAAQLVQHRRFCVTINEELQRMLDAYQTILTARRDLSPETFSSNGSQAPADHETDAKKLRHGQTYGHSKRTLTQDDGDESMDDDNDRFAGRDFMPFINT